MPDQQPEHFPLASEAAKSIEAPNSIPGNGHGTLRFSRRGAELSGVNRKMDRAVKLFAEVSEYLEKTTPKFKRLLDEVKMKIGDVGVLLQQMSDDDTSGVQRIVAPMPGTVMRCAKRVGQNVKEGEAVLILDAMKMENLITAPADGRIVALPCAEGQKVVKGSLLAVISIVPDKDLRVVR